MLKISAPPKTSGFREMKSLNSATRSPSASLRAEAQSRVRSEKGWLPWSESTGLADGYPCRSFLSEKNLERPGGAGRVGAFNNSSDLRCP